MNLAWTEELPKLQRRSGLSSKFSPFKKIGVPPVVGPAFCAGVQIILKSRFQNQKSTVFERLTISSLVALTFCIMIDKKNKEQNYKVMDGGTKGDACVS